MFRREQWKTDSNERDPNRKERQERRRNKEIDPEYEIRDIHPKTSETPKYSLIHRNQPLR